jgi:hypothetical protein
VGIEGDADVIVGDATPPGIEYFFRAANLGRATYGRFDFVCMT